MSSADDACSSFFVEATERALLSEWLIGKEKGFDEIPSLVLWDASGSGGMGGDV